MTHPRNYISVLIILLTLCLTSCKEQAANTEPNLNQKTYAPTSDDALFILGQSSVKHMEDYITEVRSNPLPAGFAFYISISGNSTREDMARYILFLRKYPNSTLQLAIWTGLRDFGTPGYYLDEVVNGEHDENIVDLANALKSMDIPVYIRFGYEFDGYHNAYPPDKYKAAYIYFVDKMRTEGVENASYVWHSWGTNAYYSSDDFPDQYPEITGVATQELWYPGDEYVDWVGLSIFGSGWGNLNQNSVIQNLIGFAEVHNKPVMLAETAAIKTSNSVDSDWVIPNTNWFANVYSLIENNKNTVKAFTYINVDWVGDNTESTWGDTRIQQSPPEVLGFWKSKISTLVHGDSELFGKIGYN